ncbi:MAG: universal stress protein [Bacteroidetes bacterium]|jgi:nucleotide-binding universal stress UspA family protein|nr:universal stress protein [Bacteroidota bacterium]
MLRIDRILFPTDFSDCAERAFNHAAHLAAFFGAELHVLHIIEEASIPAERLQQDAPEQVAVRMNQHLEDVRQQLNLDVEFVEAQVTHPSAAEGVLTYAERQQVDLIVMGTHGRRGMRRLLLGSVAEEVVRIAPCPVCTVGIKAQTLKAPTFERILVPVDFSDYSAQALRLAREIATRTGGRLHVLHVLEEAQIPGVYELESAYVNTPEAKQRTRNELTEWIEEVGGPDVPYSVHARFGYPARDIIDYAKNRQLDLIVIATHGRVGMERMLLGSVAEKVLRSATSPVLCVRKMADMTSAPVRTVQAATR